MRKVKNADTKEYVYPTEEIEKFSGVLHKLLFNIEQSPRKEQLEILKWSLNMNDHNCAWQDYRMGKMLTDFIIDRGIDPE